MTVIDQFLGFLIDFTNTGFLRIVSVVITVSIINVWMLIPGFFAVIMMILIAKKGTKPMTDSQRLD